MKQQQLDSAPLHLQLRRSWSLSEPCELPLPPSTEVVLEWSLEN